MLGDTIGFNNETVDFSPIAAKVLERKPDAVFVINGLAQHYGALLKILRSGGWNKPFCAGGAISTHEVLTIAGKAAATDFFSSSFIPGHPSNPPAMEAVAKKLIKPGKERALHLETPNGLWCLLHAIQDAQSLDPTAVKNHWEKMNTIPGTLFGTGEDGRQGDLRDQARRSHSRAVCRLDERTTDFRPLGGYRFPVSLIFVCSFLSMWRSNRGVRGPGSMSGSRNDG